MRVVESKGKGKVTISKSIGKPCSKVRVNIPQYFFFRRNIVVTFFVYQTISFVIIYIITSIDLSKRTPFYSIQFYTTIVIPSNFITRKSWSQFQKFVSVAREVPIQSPAKLICLNRSSRKSYLETTVDHFPTIYLFIFVTIGKVYRHRKDQVLRKDIIIRKS